MCVQYRHINILNPCGNYLLQSSKIKNPAFCSHIVFTCFIILTIKKTIPFFPLQKGALIL